jgi:hypothetical protein
MNICRLPFLALTGAVFVAATSPATASESHRGVYSVSHFVSAQVAPTNSTALRPVSTVRTVGAPIATQTRAEVLYVVPVIPTLLGIRPAPVGQPVIYVIDQPGAPATQRHSRSRASASEHPADMESGPRILRMEP